MNNNYIYILCVAYKMAFMQYANPLLDGCPCLECPCEREAIYRERNICSPDQPAYLGSLIRAFSVNIFYSFQWLL